MNITTAKPTDIKMISLKMVSENIEGKYFLTDVLTAIKIQQPLAYPYADKVADNLSQWIDEEAVNMLCSAKEAADELSLKRDTQKQLRVEKQQRENVYGYDVDRPNNIFKLVSRSCKVDDKMTGREFSALCDIELNKPNQSVALREAWSGARYMLSTARQVHLKNEVV